VSPTHIHYEVQNISYIFSKSVQDCARTIYTVHGICVRGDFLDISNDCNGGTHAKKLVPETCCRNLHRALFGASCKFLVQFFLYKFLERVSPLWHRKALKCRWTTRVSDIILLSTTLQSTTLSQPWRKSRN